MKRKAILFDRDGVLIADPPDKRVDTLEEVRIFPESIEALTKIAQTDYLCFIVSNQAGIAEGLLSDEMFHNVNDKMYTLLKPSGITFEKLYYSPDASDSHSDRRKPNTGMLDEILDEYDIDVENSFMIGDRDSDVEFGRRGGLQTILIQRVDGLSYSHKHTSDPSYIAKDLNEAVDIITSD